MNSTITARHMFVDVRNGQLGSKLQLASANFEPVQQFLDRMSETLTRHYGASTALERRGGCRPQP